jgi:nucleotide-binding universal stress UspA family protein
MNQSATHETVLVGVDGSSASAAAVRWAAAEAVRRRARLHAVHVVAHAPTADLGLDRETRLELQRARQSVPGKVGGLVFAEQIDQEIDLDVAVSVLTGDVASQLAREARDAVLVVIGTPHALRRSTLPVDLALACMCPVAVVGELGDAAFVEPSVPLATEGVTHARP